MLGDEVGNKAIGVTVKASQITAKLVLEVIRSIANDKYKVVNGKQSLKELKFSTYILRGKTSAKLKKYLRIMQVKILRILREMKERKLRRL